MHQKGGVGKTTLSFNIANNIKDYAKVCLIDMDAQGSLMNISSLTEIPIFNKNQVKEVLASDFDFVVIDTPPYISENLSEICDISDVIIVPTKAGLLDILAIKSTLEILKNAGKYENSLIVFNMVKPNVTLTEDLKAHLKDCGIRVAKTIISDLVVFTKSVANNGVESNNKAQKQIDNLTKEILTL